MQEKELILIIDFYGQYNQLIARRVRECNVYSEIVPFNTSIEKIKEKNPKELYSQEDLLVFMQKMHQNVQRKYLNLEFRYLEFVMECNL